MYLFGYVKPYKPELKIAEFEWYKGIYCGLCKQMGRLYGPIARMMLSYDMTFLALVSLSLKDQCHGLKRQVCIAHPLTKKNCMCACDDLSFAAHTAMIMAYYKVKDNIQMCIRDSYRTKQFCLPYHLAEGNRYGIQLH